MKAAIAAAGAVSVALAAVIGVYAFIHRCINVLWMADNIRHHPGDKKRRRKGACK